MKTKKIVYKVGERVKIINPLFVERVGYLLSLDKVQEEHISVEEKGKLKELLELMGLDTSDIFSTPRNSRYGYSALYNQILRLLAKTRIAQLSWGGKERTIHTTTINGINAGDIRYIHKKKVVKTGTYNHSSGGYDYWGEYDYTPAFLSNDKTHILLGLSHYPDNMLSSDELVWIEETNVEKYNE